MTKLPTLAVAAAFAAVAALPAPVAALSVRSVVSVPEPASALLLVTGLLGLGAVARNRSRDDD